MCLLVMLHMYIAIYTYSTLYVLVRLHICLNTYLTHPFRGQSSMVDVVNNEISSWPHVIQESFAYLKTATVLVPLFGLLWLVNGIYIHIYTILTYIMIYMYLYHLMTSCIFTYLRFFMHAQCTLSTCVI